MAERQPGDDAAASGARQVRLGRRWLVAALVPHLALLAVMLNPFGWSLWALASVALGRAIRTANPQGVGSSLQWAAGALTLDLLAGPVVHAPLLVLTGDGAVLLLVLVPLIAGTVQAMRQLRRGEDLLRHGWATHLGAHWQRERSLRDRLPDIRRVPRPGDDLAYLDVAAYEPDEDVRTRTDGV